MARNIKNRKHSDFVKELNLRKVYIQYLLICIESDKKILTADIDAKKRGENVSEAKIVYNSQALKRDRKVYNEKMKEIRQMKKLIRYASNYQA